MYVYVTCIMSLYKKCILAFSFFAEFSFSIIATLIAIIYPHYQNTKSPQTIYDIFQSGTARSTGQAPPQKYSHTTFVHRHTHKIVQGFFCERH